MAGRLLCQTAGQGVVQTCPCGDHAVDLRMRVVEAQRATCPVSAQRACFLKDQCTGGDVPFPSLGRRVSIASKRPSATRDSL